MSTGNSVLTQNYSKFCARKKYTENFDSCSKTKVCCDAYLIIRIHRIELTSLSNSCCKVCTVGCAVLVVAAAIKLLLSDICAWASATAAATVDALNCDAMAACCSCCICWSCCCATAAAAAAEAPIGVLPTGGCCFLRNTSCDRCGADRRKKRPD